MATHNTDLRTLGRRRERLVQAVSVVRSLDRPTRAVLRADFEKRLLTEDAIRQEEVALVANTDRKKLRKKLWSPENRKDAAVAVALMKDADSLETLVILLRLENDGNTCDELTTAIKECAGVSNEQQALAAIGLARILGDAKARNKTPKWASYAQDAIVDIVQSARAHQMIRKFEEINARYLPGDNALKVLSALSTVAIFTELTVGNIREFTSGIGSVVFLPFALLAFSVLNKSFDLRMAKRMLMEEAQEQPATGVK